MDMVQVTLDQDGLGTAFDNARRGTFPPGNEIMHVITKANGTETGQAIVLLAIRAVIDEKTMGWIQCVISVRQFLAAAAAITGAHPPAAAVEDPLPAGTVLHGVHRGRGYDATKIEKVYLVKVENDQRFSLAFSEQEAHAVGKEAVNLALDFPVK